MLFSQTLCYFPFQDLSEINKRMTIGSTSGFQYTDSHNMIWHQNSIPCWWRNPSQCFSVYYYSINQFSDVGNPKIFLSEYQSAEFWGLVNSSHVREKFRWKVNLQMTSQFSSLIIIIFLKGHFHFILKENSSFWILQAKPQIHPLKEQGILDMWSINSCWEASGSLGYELQRRVGRHQLLFQDEASCNCPSIAHL